MAGRTLVRRKLGRSDTTTAVPRPHFLDRPGHSTPLGSATQSAPPSTSVKLHTDDWMQVELPRGDYVFAALVATLIVLIVSSITLLPAILFFNWLTHVGASLWPKLLVALPAASGLTGAWLCLRRAKSDRIRQRLLDELRN